jgi:hypothetical protein
MRRREIAAALSSFVPATPWGSAQFRVGFDLDQTGSLGTTFKST